MAPHVGIVILNYNQPAHTLACLESLAKLDYPSYEIVVVDNGSRDGSPALVRERFPTIALIENGHNLGFAAGNNVGIAHLMNRGADYLLLLNNDTEVAPNLLTVLVAEGMRAPEAGILGPKIYYHNPPEVIWSAGGTIDKYGRPNHLHADEPDDDSAHSVQRVQEVDYITGCAFMVKREVVERVGALNEDFFIYFEETEWCARARRAGFRALYVPQARMWHKIERTARAQSRRYLYLMSRNRLLYLKCSGANSWTLLIAALELVRTAASWTLRPRHRDKRSFSGALMRGIWHFATGRFGAPPAYL